MKDKDWLMSDTSLMEKDIDSFTDLTPQEKANLKVVMQEMEGWNTGKIELVLDAMADDGVYYDITFQKPAVGREAIREFGESWLNTVPDFKSYVEYFVVKGDTVVTMGRISGTIKENVLADETYEKLETTGGKFDVQYCQVAFLENGKIKYVRDHWNAPDMYNQVGWDCCNLNK